MVEDTKTKIEEITNTDRTPRSAENRAEKARLKPWQPPSLLDAPDAPEGYVYRWIRESMVGQEDKANMSKRIREGWEPVRAEDHPELHLVCDVDSEWADKGNMEIGGLLLCKAPRELMEQRDEYYRKVAREQMEAVDNNYLKENDPRMPLLQPDRKTRTTFGGK